MKKRIRPRHAFTLQVWGKHIWLMLTECVSVISPNLRTVGKPLRGAFSAMGAIFASIVVNVLGAVPVSGYAAVNTEHTNALLDTGYAVFQAIDARHNSNYLDFEVNLEMLLQRKPQGAPVQRRLRIQQLEQVNGDQVLVVFEQPAPIRGTALLTHTYADKDDDQWLYLPAFKRVKKITTRNKSGSFVQSEFSYEDLSVPVVEKYSYQLLEIEACGELTCYVVERRAKAQGTGYSKETFWVDTDYFRTLKVNYFDEQGELLKTLTLEDYRHYFSQLWKPHLLTMTNQQTGRVTRLNWGEFRFGTGLQARRDFSVAALRRTR
ncbi:MAG: outer membrane lipoprotein-sorting protein [Pseudomonadota bacterium]